MDLDDELLALAGGDDSSDNEVAAVASKHSSPRSPVHEAKEPTDDDDAAQSRKTTARARGRKSSVDEEDPRNQIESSPSRASLHSASMSESDSEGGSIDGDDDLKPPFPYEKYFYSAKEKEEIMALPEIQREEALSERAQVYERHLQDIALRRLLATREREEATKNKKKRKGSSDVEDSPRKSTRQKMAVGGSRKVGEVSNALEAYKKQREQKEKRDKARKREAPGKRKPHSDDEADSDSDRDASDVEWDAANRRSVTPPKDDPPADLHDINRARIGRSGFSQLCFYPGFDEAISHCFVRLAIGFNKSVGRNEYRLTEIKRFVEGKPYAMEGMNKRNFVTTQYAVLAHGKTEKEFPFISCSDGPFTEGEFHRWQQTMAFEDCRMPTKSQVAEKVIDINNLINHTFTEQELMEKLRRQGAASTKQIAFERMQLEKKRDAAIAASDEALVAECDEKLRKLVGPSRLAFGTSMNKNTASKAAQHEADSLEEISRRNARLNAENVRRAQIEERRQQKIMAARAHRAETAAEHLNKTGPTESGRSNRSGTATTLTPQSEGTGEDAMQTKSQDVASTPSDSQAAAAKNGVPTIRHRPTDDDNIAALDFDLDIEM